MRPLRSLGVVWLFLLPVCTSMLWLDIRRRGGVFLLLPGPASPDVWYSFLQGLYHQRPLLVVCLTVIAVTLLLTLFVAARHLWIVFHKRLRRA